VSAGPVDKVLKVFFYDGSWEKTQPKKKDAGCLVSTSGWVQGLSGVKEGDGDQS
jgi:hypothetical protein